MINVNNTPIIKDASDLKYLILILIIKFLFKIKK